MRINAEQALLGLDEEEIARQSIINIISRPLFFGKMACKRNLDLRCVLISIPDPGTVGAGAKIRLHMPKAVTYHEQYHTLCIIHDRSHLCRFMIGQVTALGA